MDIISNNKEAIEYYQNIGSVLKDFCLPLNNWLNIPLFIYFNVFLDGSYVLLTNDINISKQYCSEILDDNVQAYVHARSLQSEKINKLMVRWPSTPGSLGGQVFFDQGYWHGLSIGNHTLERMETFSFIGHRENDRINDFFLKNTEILEKFSLAFKSKFQSIISKSEKCKARYKKGYNFDLVIPEENSNNIDSFLKAMNLDNYIKIGNQIHRLTTAEISCLEILKTGCTIKEAALNLNKSPRTVETLLDRVKGKTGIRSKSKLVALCNGGRKYL